MGILLGKTNDPFPFVKIADVGLPDPASHLTKLSLGQGEVFATRMLSKGVPESSIVTAHQPGTHGSLVRRIRCRDRASGHHPKILEIHGEPFGGKAIGLADPRGRIILVDRHERTLLDRGIRRQRPGGKITRCDHSLKNSRVRTRLLQHHGNLISTRRSHLDLHLVSLARKIPVKIDNTEIDGVPRLDLTGRTLHRPAKFLDFILSCLALHPLSFRFLLFFLDEGTGHLEFPIDREPDIPRRERLELKLLFEILRVIDLDQIAP